MSGFCKPSWISSLSSRPAVVGWDAGEGWERSGARSGRGGMEVIGARI